jgi:hypothetical protein
MQIISRFAIAIVLLFAIFFSLVIMNLISLLMRAKLKRLSPAEEELNDRYCLANSDLHQQCCIS